ncbi:WD40 repeat-like protein [Macrolepiota fuliginosa MF-IS2]|uniref:WD40 repeat-like protein n=1 Tax=Macrolepiota fuliginosa MF-IS2 TaxID=1400762 RepID=A0A9P6CAS0_9AGAR|nr:WD40 repeat-like protein [Macrolepiota fuliginosa MF-IS2]
MAKASTRTDRPAKKARTEVKAAKPRARFSEPEPTKEKPPKKSVEREVKEVASTPKNKGKAKEINPPEAKTSEEELPTTFKVVAGSYEKLLYGAEGKTTYSDDDKLQFHLKAIFAFPAHVSCIKAVAASPQGGKWLATGSADEIIKVWDLRRRKEIGGLMHHEGSVTHLIFPSRSHLLSASEDGTLCLFRARDWAVLRALKGHKGRVNSMAVHPSGKVALSVGKDKALRMWDLMRGKGVASTKLGKEGEIVRWSVDGKYFVVQSGSTIDLYNTDMTLLHTIQHPSRLHDVKFCQRVSGEGEVLLVGAEDKKLSIYDISEDSSHPPTIIAQMVGHGNRVKAVQTLRIALPPASGRTSTTIVTTVSSDGKIRVYDMYSIPAAFEKVTEIEPVAEYDTNGTRLTCVTVADGDIASSEPTNGKRKHDKEGTDEEDVNGDDDFDGIGSSDEDDEMEDEEEEEEEEGEEE